MPVGDPWPSLREVQDAEYRIRNGLELDQRNLKVDPYWADLIRLLQIFAATGDQERIETLKAEIAFQKYSPYIDSRRAMRPRPQQPAQQQQLYLL
jgi:thymidylate synthase